MKGHPKVLVIGPGPKTRGGITSVLNAYKNTDCWKKWNCIWIATYIDKSAIKKIAYAFSGFFYFLFLLPTAMIIHIHFSWDSSAKRKLPFFILSKIFRKRIVMHLHSGAEPILNSKNKAIYKYYFKNADVTILLAHSIKKELIKEFFFNSVTIVYNPCLLNSVFNLSEKQNCILFAGHINENKGVFDLLLAFSMVCKKFPDWKLLIAGSGDVSKLNGLIETLNISAQTKFLGWIREEIKDEVFKKSSFLCLPSYTEGFPMAVLDAWAYGLPVITTPVGGLPDILKHGVNSLVFESGDIENLAKNIETLIIDEKLRGELSVQSHKLSENQFNIKNIAKKLEELYSTLSQQ